MNAITILTILEKQKLLHLSRYSDLMRKGFLAQAELEQAAFAGLDQVTTEFIAQCGTEAYDLVDAVSTLVIKEESIGLFDSSATISVEIPQDFKDALSALLRDGIYNPNSKVAVAK